MNREYAVVSHKAYIEDATIGRGYTYNSYISAYENLYESYAGYRIKEVKFDHTKDFVWDACIMLLEINDHKEVVAKYPIEYYSIEKSYTMYDTNPIRLIDLMNTLYDGSNILLYVGPIERKYEYNNLEEIPDRYFDWIVDGFTYDINHANKIIMKIKIKEKK